MKIIKVITDEMPQNCGKCVLCVFGECNPFCAAIAKKINEITGNPYDMTYRRSDCPLALESGKEG